MSSDSFLTKEGFERIKAELIKLKEQSKILSEKIKEAREMGAIEDNAMFDSYIEEQGYLQGQISELEEVIGKSEIIQVVSDKNAGASLGNTIHVKFNGKEDKFVLVGSVEADPMQKRISIESPVGKALVGAKVGDTIVVETPQLKIEYYVKDIK